MKPSKAFLGVMFVFALLAAPVPSLGQQLGKVFRIGYLGVSPGRLETDPHHCPIQGTPTWQAWVEGLRERGYVPARNLAIECRYAEGQGERAPALATELVSLKVDLIVAVSTGNVRAAKEATSTIPIVMVNVVDPVGRGLVASLAQPGGNVTGLTDSFTGMEGKRLQLLKEAVPKVSRVAVLVYPTGGTPEPRLAREREAAAQALGVTVQSYTIRNTEDFAGAFAAMTKARAEALFVESDPFWWDHRGRIVDLAAQSRLPAVYPWRDFVTVGGLLAYDVNRPSIFRRLGVYVDRIFRGANPGDLPVEPPTQFDLLINLKTAKVLGLTIPQSLLSRANQVIQ